MIPHFLRCIIYHSRYQLNGPELMRARLDHFYTNNTRTVVKLIIMAEVINHQRTLVPLSLFLAGGLAFRLTLHSVFHLPSPCVILWCITDHRSLLQCTAVVRLTTGHQTTHVCSVQLCSCAGARIVHVLFFLAVYINCILGVRLQYLSCLAYRPRVSRCLFPSSA